MKSEENYILESDYHEIEIYWLCLNKFNQLVIFDSSTNRVFKKYIL
jgi:hypothetical protein